MALPSGKEVRPCRSPTSPRGTTSRTTSWPRGIPSWRGPDVGVRVHGTITGVICVLLFALNVTLAPELIWWPFPVVGMLLGLGVHWWYGYDRLEEQLRHRQEPADDVPDAADRPGTPGTTS